MRINSKKAFEQGSIIHSLPNGAIAITVHEENFNRMVGYKRRVLSTDETMDDKNFDWVHKDYLSDDEDRLDKPRHS